jgi:NADH:ubiquinone reductase (non-electrogenic)
VNRAQKGPKQKLVVLGTGWGSFRVLKSLDYSKYDVTVVSPRNHFLFTPLLASTTTGVLEFRSIMETIRTTNHEFDFVQARAHTIDFENQKVLCAEWLDENTTFEMKYDKLVIGVGADSNTFGIPGVQGNVHFLKELADARSVRNHIVQLLEEASIPGIPTEERKRLLNFVVVGGGPTGVEFAAELSDFFWSDVLKYYPNIQIQELKITLVEAGDTILSAFSSTVAEQAMKNIKRQGIDMKLHTKVKEVQPQKIILDDGSIIHCGMIVWSTGVGPRKMIRELGLELDHGRLPVDDYLQLKGHQNVFALGDCAAIEGKPLPATAQVAHQQALYLAKQLNGKLPLDKKTHLKQTFQYYPIGLMAYVGSYKSVFDTSFFKGTGWLEFIAWRSVYLTRLGSWKNKMMVPYNWLKTLIWGRDVSFF